MIEAHKQPHRFDTQRTDKRQLTAYNWRPLISVSLSPFSPSSSPNASIGDPVFHEKKAGFPLRSAAGITSYNVVAILRPALTINKLWVI
jgi:hypothetical protein